MPIETLQKADELACQCPIISQSPVTLQDRWWTDPAESRTHNHQVWPPLLVSEGCYYRYFKLQYEFVFFAIAMRYLRDFSFINNRVYHGG